MRSHLFVIVMTAWVMAVPARASVEISANPTNNMNCTAGICTPTAKNADLNATDLANMLATGDVKVVTGNGAVTITVTAPFSWTSSHRLTLDANLNVSFKAPVIVAGQGAVTIVTNDGGTGGDLIFFDGGKLDFWDLSSSLIIDNHAYKLVSTIKMLASNIKKSGYYAFSQDYDASLDGHYSSTPINAIFAGVFNGLGHTLSNLAVGVSDRKKSHHERKYVSLFQTLHAGGSITSLRLAHEIVTGVRRDREYVSGVVGENSGTVRRCFAEVTIDSHGNAGGLVGYNYGAILDSSANANISARSYAGGIAAYSSGSIQYSNTAGAVTGGEVGGVVGYSNGHIANSWSSATITGSGPESVTGGLAALSTYTSMSYASGSVSGAVAGGLVGNNNGTIDRSYSSGDVSGTQAAGGLVGGNGTIIGVKISNSYATGNVTGSGAGMAGGLEGANCCSGTISNSYSTGMVKTGTFVGGLIGDDYANKPSVADGYWDLDTSGISDPSRGAGSPLNDSGITGLTNAQLKSALPAGFDPAIWAISKKINNGYPYLIANPPE